MRVAVAVVVLAACGEVGKLPPDAVVEKDLMSLAIAPSEGHVRLGKQLKLTANATYDTGVEDVTGTVEWSVMNQTGMATVVAGIVNGAGRGRVVVTATLEGQTASTTLDVNAGVLVAGDIATPAVLTYSADANGNLAPTHRIAGAATTLSAARSVAIVGDEIAVVDHAAKAIRFFPLQANGNTAPTRVIAGPATLLEVPITIEQLGDELFIGNASSANNVLVFAVTASGNVAPKRRITNIGPAFQHLDVDGGEIYIADYQSNSVKVYAKDAANDAAPLRAIAGPLTQLRRPSGIVAHGDELFVATVFNEAGTTDAILVFPRDARGDVAPVRKIEGLQTQLAYPDQLRVFENKLYVGNYEGKSLLAFPIDGTGDIPPVQAIGGDASGVTGAPGIALY